MEDEDRLGIPSYDESLASDYIRNRIEPPEDIVSGRTIFKVEAVEQLESEYEKELKKLHALTSEQLDNLLSGVEKKSKEGHGLFSKGRSLNGYAIDIPTLQSLQSTHHDEIDFELAAKITTKLQDSGDTDADIDTIKRRVIPGIVYLEVPGFKTPIVKLFLGHEEMGNLVPINDVDKIATYLKKERKLLPISFDFQVL